MDWNDLEAEVGALLNAQAEVERQLQLLDASSPNAERLRLLEMVRDQAERLQRFVATVNRLRQ
jgi:hypothetical protein